MSKKKPRENTVHFIILKNYPRTHRYHLQKSLSRSWFSKLLEGKE